MNNLYMTSAFEREKNIQATIYTFMVCLALFLIFFFIKWTTPVIPPPLFEEGIEVNLGNSETGFGDIAPMIPGEPSAANETNFNPPPKSTEQPVEQNIKGDENEADEAAPTVNNTPKPVTKPPVNKPDIVKPKPIVKNEPAPNPTPAPPKPKAVYSGGTSTTSGGNNADSYNNVRNQGIAGGTGDQGKPGGNPNSDSYTGTGGTGNSGVRIRSGLGGRRFTKLPSFEDDFNENAKVAVDIIVDKNGNVISAKINLSGTTTTNANVRSIALRKARELKLNVGEDDEQSGTILFDFKLKG